MCTNLSFGPSAFTLSYRICKLFRWLLGASIWMVHDRYVECVIDCRWRWHNESWSSVGAPDDSVPPSALTMARHTRKDKSQSLNPGTVLIHWPSTNLPCRLERFHFSFSRQVKPVWLICLGSIVRTYFLPLNYKDVFFLLGHDPRLCLSLTW